MKPTQKVLYRVRSTGRLLDVQLRPSTEALRKRAQCLADIVGETVEAYRVSGAGGRTVNVHTANPDPSWAETVRRWSIV